MDILKDKTDSAVLQSLLAEIAKSKNEINLAKQDITKANNRLGFALVLVNELINRRTDK